MASWRTDLSSGSDDTFEEFRAEIERGGDYRLLRRVPSQHPVLEDDGAEALTLAVVDVETTGLTPTDKIVELAVRRLKISQDGRLLGLGESRSWLEDPGSPLSAEVSAITGLTDDDLAGQRIDDRTATAVLRSADLIVAHNAAFDRPFVERRLPGTAGAAWACTCNELDWRALGFEGRSLSHLLFQIGFFFDGHRASADVDALITLLLHRGRDRRTIVEMLIQVSRMPTMRLDAVGAPFESSKVLRERGYRWDAMRRVWWREVLEELSDAEAAWLDEAVYLGRGGPNLTRVTWRERHG